MSDVPYVNAERRVARGIFVMPLTLNDDVAQRPNDHVVHFAGDYPCRKDGTPITGLQNQSQINEFVPGLRTNHSFSNKPPEGYPNYYAKVTRYIDIVSHPAVAIDPAATAKTFPLVKDDAEVGPFHYEDTASSRAGIAAANAKLAGHKVAIVGLGGSGSYTLDFVAKTPVDEVHLFDGDRFLQHNAFRAPGAASPEQLRSQPNKAAHFARVYGAMKRGIVAHEYNVDASNVAELDGFGYVFLCLDHGAAKRAIVAHLQAKGIPFVDVGMGLEMTDGRVAGVLRVTTSSAKKTDHVERRIPFGDGEDDLYARNIQVAELNALNATLAVIKWKKLCDFYRDLEKEHHTTFTLDGNAITNEDPA